MGQPTLPPNPVTRTIEEARRSLMERILGRLDARVPFSEQIRKADAARHPALVVPREGQVALVGHRAAGKSRVLGLVGAWCGRPVVDLDRHLEETHDRSIREWFEADAASFREAERKGFSALPPGRVVSCGGGFLSLHADLLGPPHVAVLVPVSFDTYFERLSKDRHRPRLRPELSLEDELRTIYEEREQLHANGPVVDLVTFLVRTLHVGKSFS